jgi:RND family efflux transporter MFP subunit
MKSDFPGDSDPPLKAEAVDPTRSAPRVKVGRALIFLIMIGAATAATGIFGRRHDNQLLARWTDEQAIPSISVVSPKPDGETRELVLPGNVDAFYTAAIHAQVSGYVREWRRDIGAEVHRGDVLAVIDTPELDESIAVAQSELAKAKADLVMAQVTAKRWDSLRASAAVSQQAADEKESDALVKTAQVAAAQSNIDRLKAQKAFANITAPFDGVVTARNVDVGSLVKADGNDGTSPLFSVADIHQMRVYVPVPETYASEITVGMKATLDLPEAPNRKFEATIGTTAHAIDQKSRTLLVELLADNKDGALTPGSFTRVHFHIPPDQNVLRIPASALLYRDNTQEIAILGADSRVTLTPVKIARDLGSEIEIAGGSANHARIVDDPPDSMSDGEEVRVVDMTSDKDKPNAAAERRNAPPAGEPRATDTIAETGRKSHE